MLRCNNKIWIENIMNLFCDFKLLPLSNMTLEAKINSLTRLIIFISILFLLVFDIKYSLFFLLTSLLIIIIFYYLTLISLLFPLAKMDILQNTEVI